MKVRQNVYDLKDDTLSWYSKAVEAMKAKDINDPTSWWYQGAVHGYRIDYPSALAFWQDATGYPPSNQTVNSGFWNRCQHGTWYFLPWHRIYLYYFELIVAKVVEALGGPQDWALPYWNYCDYYNDDAPIQERQQALQLPPEFGTAQAPAANYPGLWIKDRRNYVLNSQNADPRRAMSEPQYTSDAGDINFGGGVTGFSHFGRETGQLESLPHNVVHSNIGGAMGDPNTAARTGFFWLHHANIDRLWDVWLKQPGRENASRNAWKDFPFKFHDADGNPVTKAVKEAETTAQLDYQYTDNYPLPEQIAPAASALRVATAMDVVGAGTETARVGGDAASINLEMVPKPFRNASLGATRDEESANQKSILRLSNITGKGAAPPLDVFINKADSAEDEEAHFVGSIGLFGLEDSSIPSVQHDGSGLSFALDVSEIVDGLRQRDDWDEENITIQLVPQSEKEDEVEINVGRISLHSECTA